MCVTPEGSAPCTRDSIIYMIGHHVWEILIRFSLHLFDLYKCNAGTLSKYE